jgi:SOS-response transcriptional repressor LexA
MIFRDIYDGDTVIFQQSGFEYVENGKVVVIEKVGEEEGFWSLEPEETHDRAASVVHSQ